MEWWVYLVIAIASILVFIVFAFVLYNILKKCVNFVEKTDKFKVLSEYRSSISNSRLHNSIICTLKKKLKQQLKDFCDGNGVESIKAESAQYGVLMVKIGFDYIQHQMSHLMNKICDDEVCRRMLLLDSVISVSKNSIFMCNVHKSALIKYEMQNMLYTRILLKNILNLVKDTGLEHQVELMIMYCVKLDYGLSFISKGLSFVSKDVKALDKFCDNTEPRYDGFFYDDDPTFTSIPLDNDTADAVNFTVISLHDIEGYVR